MVLIIVLIILFIIFAHNLYFNNCLEAYSQNTKHKLCIMAIFKNEQEYLEEWLIHHLKQGISHFYLYSNDNNMNNYKYWNYKYCKPFLKQNKKENNREVKSKNK